MANLKLEMPKDKDLQAKVIDAHAQQESRAQEMGLFGKVFGGASEKPGNVAGFAVVVSFLAVIGVMIWMTDSASLTRKDVILIFVSIITLALGYIFGRGDTSA